MATGDRSSDLGSSVGRLTIDSEKSNSGEAAGKPPAPKPKTAVAAKKKKKHEVADSWEDEEVSSDDGDVPASPPPSKTQPAGITAPPPTPSTPSYHGSPSPTPFGGNAPLSANWEHLRTTSGSGSGGGSGTDGPSRRPEKTDAVARRLIAGALGIRAPRMTEEQRVYEKSLREAERKRREDSRAAERQQQEEADKAKKAIWDD